MEFKKESLVRKARSIVSAFYGIVFWVTRMSSSVQAPKAFLAHQYFQLGLSALICSTTQNLKYRSACIFHSYMIPTTASPSTSSSSSSSSTHSSSPSYWFTAAMGDLIGTENGVYMGSNEGILPGKKTKPYTCRQSKRDQRQQKRGEYPPPIPSLARTGNLPGRMPWILTRHNVDGRLILKEERVNHYEYFESRRENGRLILNLIPLEVFEDDENLKLEEDLNFIEEGIENTGGEGLKVDEADNDSNNHDNVVNDDSTNEDDDDGYGINGEEGMVVDPMVLKEFMMSLASSMPETYAGGTILNNRSFFHMQLQAPVNGAMDRIVQPSSAPLSLTLCDVA